MKNKSPIKFEVLDKQSRTTNKCRELMHLRWQRRWHSCMREIEQLKNQLDEQINEIKQVLEVESSSSYLKCFNPLSLAS